MVNVDIKSILSLEDGPGLENRIDRIEEEDHNDYGGTVDLFVNGMHPVKYRFLHVHYETLFLPGEEPLLLPGEKERIKSLVSNPQKEAILNQDYFPTTFDSWPFKNQNF